MSTPKDKVKRLLKEAKKLYLESSVTNQDWNIEHLIEIAKMLQAEENK